MMWKEVIAVFRAGGPRESTIRQWVVWDSRALLLLAALSGFVFSTPASASTAPTNATGSATLASAPTIFTMPVECIDVSGTTAPTQSDECSWWEASAVWVFCLSCPFLVLLCLDAIGMLIASIIGAATLPGAGPLGLGPLITAIASQCIAAAVGCWACVLSAEACGDDAAADEGRRQLQKIEAKVDSVMQEINQLTPEEIEEMIRETVEEVLRELENPSMPIG